MQVDKPRFGWGKEVRVAQEHGLPLEWRPGSLGEVCGVRTVENDQQAAACGQAIGTVMYIVEFEDGSSVEIAAYALEPSG
jgi:hypothetical protein